MIDFDDIKNINAFLKKAQDGEEDTREQVREDIHFLHKLDGQWEPEVSGRMSGRPTYTFDKCNPVVDSIAGEIEQADFAIRIRPSGGEATEDVADVLNGMIRNIQNISGAVDGVFNPAARKMVESGFDAFRIVQDWSDTDSFEQDLFIRKIGNAVDRVWFDPSAEKQDMSDADYCFVLQTLSKAEYEARFPEGSGSSVNADRSNEVYTHKPDLITVGEFIYKKPIVKELVLMSNNAVYEVDDKFESVVAELAEEGITEQRRRKKKSHKVVTRFFDGADWLDKEKDTVFSLIPVIPVYGNFSVSEDKIIYRGAINKLKDPQRVYNYLQSRIVEEGALAPRDKTWMTKKQAAGHEAQLRTMNTNADPVQFYTHEEGVTPPYRGGGSQINPGLQQSSNDMKANIVEGSGIFAASQGNAPNQSGIAIEMQQNKGDTSTIKYFKSIQVAIRHAACILVDAIPKVYDTKRTIRVLGEDGVANMKQINDTVIDEQTGRVVALNDLSKGRYDVVCDYGPAFKNRQQETTQSFLNLAQIDPSILQQNKDIFLSNITSPGMDSAAERARKQLLEAGQIPDKQMTDEEKEQAQALIMQAQQEAAMAAQQPPSIMEQSMIEQTQANTANTLSMAQERQNKAVAADRKQDLDEAKFVADREESQLEMMAKQQQQFFENMMAQREQDMQRQQLMTEVLNKQSETLKTLKDAMGVDTIIGPTNTEAYKNQADIVTDTQEAGN